MIKVIKAIINQDATKTFLYNNFYQNPKLIKDIYYSLDNEGTSTLDDGQKVPNKSIFASLLLAITYDYYLKTKQSFTTVASFQIDDTHRVDSNLFVRYDNSKETYNLGQEVKVTSKQGGFYTTSGGGGDYETITTDWKKVGDAIPLHPLDLVNLTIPLNGKELITIPFPAIMVKDMAHHEEWSHVMDSIRFAGNIVAIVFGGAALLSGNPFLIILAIADIGLASTDIYVQIRKDEYMKTPEGRAFLDTWEKVYTIGGLGIAILSAPELITSLLTSGARLFSGVSKASLSTKKFLTQIMTKVILASSEYIGVSKEIIKSIEIGGAILRNAPVKFSLNTIKRLEEAGVLFVKIENFEGQLAFAAYFEGTPLIPSGSSKELKSALKSVWSKTGKDLSDELQKLSRETKTKVKNQLWEKTFNLDNDVVTLLKNNKLKVQTADNLRSRILIVEEITGDIIYYGNKKNIKEFVEKISRSHIDIKKDFKKIEAYFQNSPSKFNANKLTRELKDGSGITINLVASKLGLSVDFSKTPQYLYKGQKKYGQIKIKLTGNTDFDFKQAYKKAGIDQSQIDKIEEEYTWHHLDDFDPTTRECTMQLVQKDAHRASYKHIGGAGMFKALINFLYKERSNAFKF